MDVLLAVLLLAVMAYPMIGLFDLNIADAYLKKHLWYPMMEFRCFCGHTVNLWSWNVFPGRVLHIYKARKHMRGCLSWILNAEFNGLTPYWAVSLAEAIENGSVDDMLGRAWHIERHKIYSQRAKSGKDPFKEDPTTAPDHGIGDQV